MDLVFDDWKKLLQSFKDSVEKDLKEIHKQKSEIQQMKIEIFDRLDRGLYYRDDNRIVISAPEIVIGNVSKSGDLLGGCGKVIIKGSEVALDGVGADGSIVSRAPSIQQLAVDPGIDGVEAVVCETSQIVSQAKSISLESNEATDVFAKKPALMDAGGISIHADKQLSLNASTSLTDYKATLEQAIADTKAEYEAQKKEMTEQKKTVDKWFDDISKYFDENKKKVGAKDFQSRVELLDIEDIHDKMEEMLPQMYQVTSQLIQTISAAAEAKRKNTALTNAKSKLPAEDAFLNNSTGAQVDIVGEIIKMENNDGDGNLRTNPIAGIEMTTPSMNIKMNKPDGTLIDDSMFIVNSQNFYFTSSNPSKDGKNTTVVGSMLLQAKDVNIESIDYTINEGVPSPKSLTADSHVTITSKTVNVDATNPTNAESDKTGKLTKGEFKAEGEVNIRSKTINMETLDYELADGKLKAKTLPAGSSINMRTEKVAALTVDTEGKATGSILLDSKNVELKSMNVDKESLECKELAEGSSTTILSDKLLVDGDKKVQMKTKEMLLYAEKTLEGLQGDEKNPSALVQLNGNKTAIGGSDVSLNSSNIKLAGNTEVKGTLKAPTGEFENVKASSSVTSPNFKDGIAKPVTAKGESLQMIGSIEDMIGG